MPSVELVSSIPSASLKPLLVRDNPTKFAREPLLTYRRGCDFSRNTTVRTAIATGSMGIVDSGGWALFIFLSIPGHAPHPFEWVLRCEAQHCSRRLSQCKTKVIGEQFSNPTCCGEGSLPEQPWPTSSLRSVPTSWSLIPGMALLYKSAHIHCCEAT